MPASVHHRPLRQRLQAWAWQLLLLLLLLGIVWFFAHNTVSNLRKNHIASGFAFWHSTAGFDIIFHIIPYDEASSYGRAFMVGLANTLLVSVLGILGATILGFLIGLMRLSRHWLVQALAWSYVEVVRNLPLLLQLFFWYFAVLRTLPAPRESLDWGGMIFLNIRGLYLPSYDLSQGHWNIPHLEGFDFEGGFAIIPELLALVVALITYTAAFIAEVVRGGIMAVPKGQEEAAIALGLNRAQCLRHVILPQAMRVIVPPLTNQYLNLTKNSSLAAAIAFPDLVHVFAGTVLLQTGQAVEIVAVTMGVYLFISLLISGGMAVYNRRVLFVEK